MSIKGTFGLAFAEKIIGLILVVIGAALAYYTYVNPDAVGMGSGYFIAVGAILTILGLMLVIVRTR